MHLSMITKVLGLLLVIFSFTMLPPAFVAWLYQDGGGIVFLISFAATLVLGLVMWLPLITRHGELQARDGFLVVTLTWVVLSAIGALPLVLQLHITYTDALFETMSGLTTTGATVLSHLQSLPHSILYYREQLHWIGGMGFVVLATAILPMLGVGGMQLYRAEVPGPAKDAKLTPRIAETAKTLWYVYVAITVIGALAYWWAGMTPFDAICHSFSTISTGGFSNYDDSFMHYHSWVIDTIGSIYMLVGATNFALHFSVWREKSVLLYIRDPEFRFYIGLMFCNIVIVSVGLWIHHVYSSPGETLRHGAFQLISFATDTGLVNSNYVSWPAFIPFVMVFSAFIGGCAGSTGGGLKVVRAAVAFQQGHRELKRLIFPNGVFALTLGGRAVDDRILQAIWGFIGVFVTLSVIMVLMLTAAGMDFASATSALSAAINNMGIGTGQVGSNFEHIPDMAKWILTFAMLLGRLEVFTILVLFTPMFWRQ